MQTRRFGFGSSLGHWFKRKLLHYFRSRLGHWLRSSLEHWFRRSLENWFGSWLGGWCRRLGQRADELSLEAPAHVATIIGLKTEVDVAIAWVLGIVSCTATRHVLPKFVAV